MIGQIARDTGWSVNYIMRGVNYPMLMMMWQDFPRHVEGRKKSTLELFQEMEEENNATGSKPKNVAPLAFFQELEKEEE